jgi:hypothetical protein
MTTLENTLKSFLTISLMLTALTGCVSTSNKAHQYTPTPIPELAGLWVGSGGGQTQYMVLRPNGTGELCFESMSTYRTTPVTISGDKMVSTGEGNFKRNADGTISNCVWGICMTYKKTENVAAACREWLK